MIFLKTYHSYLVRVFINNFLMISLVFICLSFFLNIFEEIKFFENLEVSFFIPIILTLLNVPTIFFELMPFIFLISAIFFFIYISDRNELSILKNNGIDNLKIVIILSLTSIVLGLFVISIYYTISSNLKNTYLNYKNKHSSENEYLAVVNENGLWLKEDFGGYINIINAKTFKNNILKNITITKLDTKYQTIETIISKKANIQNKKWQMENVKIINPSDKEKNYTKYDFGSNFNGEIVSNLFSNLNSLNILQLHNQMKNYENIGYSTTDIKHHLNKIYTLPLYFVLMTIIGCLLMLRMKFLNSKFFMLVIGVFISVLIYYLNFFLSLFGLNETLPIEISVWLPQLLLVLVIFLGLIRINEK